MGLFSVSSRGSSPLEVEADNWITALGKGLQELGRSDEVERLACERLPNGTVIARDISSGTGYVIQGIELPEEDPTALPDDKDELMEVEPDDDRLDHVEAAETISGACQLALMLALDLVPSESGAVILEDVGYLRFVTVMGPRAIQLQGVRLPLGTGVAGFAMQKRRSVVLANASDDPRHCGEVDALIGYVTGAILVVPIVKGDSVFGVLELMNPPDGERFSREDVHRLTSVASALGERLAR